MIVANVAGAAWIDRPPGRWRTAGSLSAAAILLFALALGFGHREMSLPAGDGPPVTVGVIQASVPQDEKWSLAAASGILEKHERLTGEAAAAGARLILWPESSSPFPLSRPARQEGRSGTMPDRLYRGRMESLSGRTGASLLFAGPDGDHARRAQWALHRRSL